MYSQVTRRRVARNLVWREADYINLRAQVDLILMEDWRGLTQGLGFHLAVAAALPRAERCCAEQGNAPAQFNLGLMYYNGEGVPQNDIQAHMWFNLAGARGNENAREARDIVKDRMTPEQTAEAQHLASEWRPGTEKDRVLDGYTSTAIGVVSTPAENCTFMAGENCTPDDWVTNPKTPAPPGISCER